MSSNPPSVNLKPKPPAMNVSINNRKQRRLVDPNPDPKPTAKFSPKSSIGSRLKALSYFAEVEREQRKRESKVTGRQVIAPPMNCQVLQPQAPSQPSAFTPHNVIIAPLIAPANVLETIGAPDVNGPEGVREPHILMGNVQAHININASDAPEIGDVALNATRGVRDDTLNADPKVGDGDNALNAALGVEDVSLNAAPEVGYGDDALNAAPVIGDDALNAALEVGVGDHALSPITLINAHAQVLRVAVAVAVDVGGDVPHEVGAEVESEVDGEVEAIVEEHAALTLDRDGQSFVKRAGAIRLA